MDIYPHTLPLSLHHNLFSWPFRIHFDSKCRSLGFHDVVHLYIDTIIIKYTEQVHAHGRDL